ncbi:hypothetical protein LOK49_LG08G01101 [Camellia lanceoleosa]|uniref:Uncharacterized protein n=1 Tax=Camellia lanceoleosa TaxID=1840588 RepID=A0ACC0GR19_9ERIC|nr:hypothetical protein LOK49_LG08G01101 [Camellia lanceoleosa]
MFLKILWLVLPLELKRKGLHSMTLIKIYSIPNEKRCR